jgi:hypothetical protein
MPWKKGESGNPGGRSRVVGDIRELCRKEGEKSIATIVALRDDKKTPQNVRLAAAQQLLDRGFGRPVQGINMTSAVPFVLFASQPASNAQEWLEQARAAGLDVPFTLEYDIDATNGKA